MDNIKTAKNQRSNAVIRFALVGILNTIVDIIALNILLWRFPTSDTLTILTYNAIACAIAAVNSFMLNRVWTFRYKEKITLGLLMRFSGVSLLSLLGNTAILWLLIQVLPPSWTGAGPGATALKGLVAAAMMFLSFIGQSTLVFVKKQQQKAAHINPALRPGFFPVSLSAVLPAYNEEEIIATTISKTFQALSQMLPDFEIIVVNDGSKDRTGAIVASIAAREPRVRLINHEVNQGAGAALVSGFLNARKRYTFYMDSDGQFDIYDLSQLLPYLGEYDGVFGYRYNRQDPPLRKLNAWGWNQIVRFVFRVSVRDIDCAFKIFRTNYFKEVALEAKGALLLTEIVYKFARAGYSYAEVPVKHLPREKGEATGAKPTVILKAFREMFFYAAKWYAEENSTSSR